LDILKRFNSYSNNDIERLGANLGTPQDLTHWLSARWGESGKGVNFASLSGLGSNRLSARQIVHLMNDLDASARTIGITLDEVLPVTGCDPGTGKNYPQLHSLLKGNLRAKTGSLRYTDGGVSVLAGIMDAAQGRRTFAVVKPNSGIHTKRARLQQEQWVVDLIARSGGAPTMQCGNSLLFSDANIDISAS
jgi:D-alanyl-D-alanine carboxypeptidase